MVNHDSCKKVMLIVHVSLLLFKHDERPIQILGPKTLQRDGENDSSQICQRSEVSGYTVVI